MSTKVSQRELKHVLVTGGAGFIGSHLIDSLLPKGIQITVLDSFNNFYNPAAKRRNIKEHLKQPNYRLVEGDLRDDLSLDLAFKNGPFDTVVHLAAMAGVRPSLEQPALYMDINVVGTQKLIDRMLQCNPAPRLVFGSSSSVYGKRSGETFLETDRIDQPLSPYAASKVAGEAICYASHHTRGLNAVCLRFFTVYGPRQRPDLAIHKFCNLIEQNKTIEIFGDGKSRRDYTFVSDIVDGIERSMIYDLPGFEIINLGSGRPLELMEMINQLQAALNTKASVVHKPFQIGDMPYTYAAIEKAGHVLGWKPEVSFAEGIKAFVQWHLDSKVAQHYPCL